MLPVGSILAWKHLLSLHAGHQFLLLLSTTQLLAPDTQLYTICLRTDLLKKQEQPSQQNAP